MAARAGLGVVRGPLMRVLAVGQRLLALEGEQQPGRKRLDVGEPGCDRRLVGGGVRESLGGELAPGVERDAALGELAQDLLVARGLADGDDVDEALGRGPQQRRAADVDHLDGFLLADVPPRGHALEGIEVDADEVERGYLVLPQLVEVRLQPAASEDPRVDPRVERLHPAAQELGDLGQLLDRDDVDPVL